MVLRVELVLFLEMTHVVLPVCACGQRTFGEESRAAYSSPFGHVVSVLWSNLYYVNSFVLVDPDLERS